MKQFKALLAVLLTALLLLGCARGVRVGSPEEAIEPLHAFLQELAHHDTDEYECDLKDTLTQDGMTVYLFEVFWHAADGERYPIGIFRVDEEGTVMIDSVPSVD